MKKIKRLATLCLSLVLMLGIMAMPASAEMYDRMYVVWTEEEFWDLDNPRPVPPEKTFIVMFVVTEGDTFDYDKAYDADNHYMDTIYQVNATCDTGNGLYSKAEVQASAWEAYDRNTDAAWKKRIADTFSLKTDSDNGSGGSTATEPEKPTTTPVTPVTPPVTTPTTTGKVTSFSDVKKGDWYYEAVMALANSGILAGYADGTFRPNQTITTGELATILCRVYGIDLSVPVGRSSLKHIGHDDSTVNTGHWAENAMNSIAKYGSGRAFSMCVVDMELNRGWAISHIADSITRATWPDGTKLSSATTAEREAILTAIPDIAADYAGACSYGKYTEDRSHYPDYRLRQLPALPAAKTGEEVIAQNYVVENRTNERYDSDLSAWNPSEIALAYHIGLVNGVDSTGRCDPWAPITRAQVVQMLYNLGITQAGQLQRPENAAEAAMSGGVIIGFA